MLSIIFAGLIGLAVAKPVLTRSSDCTSTLLHTPKFTFGPTRTIWTETSAVTRTVDCGSCNHVIGSVLPFGVPPVVLFNTAVTATEPWLRTTFECARDGVNAMTSAMTPAMVMATATATATATDTDAATATAMEMQMQTPATEAIATASAAESTAPAAPPVFPQPVRHMYWAAQPVIRYTVTPSGISSPDCTRTFGLAPGLPVATHYVYPSTTTRTSRMECDTCALVWSTASAKYSQRVLMTKTVTKHGPSIATALTCSKP